MRSMSEMDAVLPLIPRDLERFALLARSLDAFFPTLGRLVVVVPDRHHDAMNMHVRRALRGIPVEVVTGGEPRAAGREAGPSPSPAAK